VRILFIHWLVPLECSGELSVAIGTGLSDRLGLHVSIHSIAQEGTAEVPILPHLAAPHNLEDEKDFEKMFAF